MCAVDLDIRFDSVDNSGMISCHVAFRTSSERSARAARSSPRRTTCVGVLWCRRRRTTCVGSRKTCYRRCVTCAMIQKTCYLDGLSSLAARVTEYYSFLFGFFQPSPTTLAPLELGDVDERLDLFPTEIAVESAGDERFGPPCWRYSMEVFASSHRYFSLPQVIR